MRAWNRPFVRSSPRGGKVANAAGVRERWKGKGSDRRFATGALRATKELDRTSCVIEDYKSFAYLVPGIRSAGVDLGLHLDLQTSRPRVPRAGIDSSETKGVDWTWQEQVV